MFTCENNYFTITLESKNIVLNYDMYCKIKSRMQNILYVNEVVTKQRKQLDITNKCHKLTILKL